MGPVRNGVQWTSRVISRTRAPALFAAPALSLSIHSRPDADRRCDRQPAAVALGLLARSVTGRPRSFELPGEADRLRSQADAANPQSSA